MQYRSGNTTTMHVQLPHAHNIKMAASVGEDLSIIPFNLHSPVGLKPDYVESVTELLPPEK